jgi:hypothetical protein
LHGGPSRGTERRKKTPPFREDPPFAKAAKGGAPEKPEPLPQAGKEAAHFAEDVGLVRNEDVVIRVRQDDYAG